MTEPIRFDSPAKVNLRLEILKKREDGYHELRTVFQKISLQDILHFSLKKGKGVSITTNHPDLPVGKDNLAAKAAQRMLALSGFQGGVHIEIEKNIPLGAGLGGGSSNAATTLKALNQILGMKCSRKELMEMGVKIGADVPFFFLRGAALGSGIGEKLKKIEIPALWYVLIYPNFEVSTRWAYQSFILTNKEIRINLHKFLSTPEGISRILLNHLEPVVSKRHPQIGIMKKMLLSAGALGALMSGSGPTVFGIFSEEKMALEAYETINRTAGRRGWSIYKANSITT